MNRPSPSSNRSIRDGSFSSVLLLLLLHLYSAFSTRSLHRTTRTASGIESSCLLLRIFLLCVCSLFAIRNSTSEFYPFRFHINLICGSTYTRSLPFLLCFHISRFTPRVFRKLRPWPFIPIIYSISSSRERSSPGLPAIASPSKYSDSNLTRPSSFVRMELIR